MNRRSDEAAESILAPLTESQRERLVAAMAEVHALLHAAGARIERVDPASREARWCVSQYFAELASRFEDGFEPERSILADDAETGARGTWRCRRSTATRTPITGSRSTSPDAVPREAEWIST
jgi:hypothetical protein